MTSQFSEYLGRVYSKIQLALMIIYTILMEHYITCEEIRAY